MSSLAWDCYGQKLPAIANVCTFKIKRFYRRIWISGFFGNMEERFTGQQEYSLELSPQKWCSARQCLTRSTPVSQPHSQTHDRVQAGQAGKEMEDASLGRKLPIMKEHPSKGSGGGVSHHHMDTLLEFFFPHHNVLKAERALKMGISTK